MARRRWLLWFPPSPLLRLATHIISGVIRKQGDLAEPRTRRLLGGSGPAPTSIGDPDFSDGFTTTSGNHVVDEPKAAIRIVFRQRGRGIGLFCVGFPT